MKSVTLLDLIEIYNFNTGRDLNDLGAIFADIELDTRLDKNILIGSILDECGAMRAIYDTTPTFKYFSDNFFKKYKWNIGKLVDTLEAKYDPLINKSLEWTETTDIAQDLLTEEGREEGRTKNNTGTQTTNDTGTQTVEDTGTQTTENTGTQTTRDTGTQTTNETGTQTTNETGTQTTNETGTQTTNETGTQTTNETGTQTNVFDEDQVNTVSAMNSSTYEPDNMRETDSTNTRTDNLQNQRTDNLQNQRTDNLQNQRTDNLQNQRTDNLESERTDNLESQRTDNLQSERTDNLQSQRTDNLTETIESSIDRNKNENLTWDETDKHIENGLVNITYQELLEKERKIAQFSIYNWITKKYAKELFLLVY